MIEDIKKGELVQTKSSSTPYTQVYPLKQYEAWL